MAGSNCNGMRGKRNVLIVDDSAVMRQVMTATLEQEPDICVQGAVSDPIFAMQRMSKAWPDVILLDIEMPRMDGITFLRKIMAERPTPVVICSSLTRKGTETAIHALAAGAVAVVAKPERSGGAIGWDDAFVELVQAVRAAGDVQFRQSRPEPAANSGNSRPAPDELLKPSKPAAAATRQDRALIAIGASTGGTQALHHLLGELDPSCPGIVIVQHMPEKFTASFAERLNECSELEVREARNGDRVREGLALIAPGGRHMTVVPDGRYFQVRVFDGPAVNRHRPSVDVLFRSVAQHVGKRAIGLIMTGMGSDGATGLMEMRTRGAYTLAQDESTCVVYGMPKEAVKRGAVDASVPLPRIAAAILENI